MLSELSHFYRNNQHRCLIEQKQKLTQQLAIHSHWHSPTKPVKGSTSKHPELTLPILNSQRVSSKHHRYVGHKSKVHSNLRTTLLDIRKNIDQRQSLCLAETSPKKKDNQQIPSLKQAHLKVKAMSLSPKTEMARSFVICSPAKKKQRKLRWGRFDFQPWNNSQEPEMHLSLGL